MVAGLLLAGCAQKTHFMSLASMRRAAGLSTLPMEEEYKEYGAVVLYENQKTEFLISQELYRKESFTRALVYFNSNAEGWLTPSIYIGPHDHLVSFSARTICPDGSTIELSRADLYPTELKPDFVEFSDNQSVKFTFSGVEPNSVLQYSYTIDRWSHFGAFDTWWIQSTIPKMFSSYTIKIPTFFFEGRVAEELKWCYSPKNINLPEPTIRDTEASTTVAIKESKYKLFTWELKDIDALEYESMMPGYTDRVQHVVLGIGVKDWDALASAYWGAVKHCFIPTSKTGMIARRITRGARNESEEIERVLDYTQKNMRYVAITVDDSGAIPNGPDLILERKYGDCKDMTVLNISLLKSLGYKACPALVKTRSAGLSQTTIVNLDYNHMIALVYGKDGRKYWLDSTAEECPLSVIHPEIAGATAFVLMKDGSYSFETIPESSAEDNTVRRETRVTLEEDGQLTGRSKVILTGIPAYAFRSGFRNATEEDLADYLAAYISKDIKNPEISEISHSSFDKLESGFVFDFTFEGSLSTITGSEILILNPSVIPLRAPMREYDADERQNEIVLNSAYLIRDDLWISWDADALKLKGRPASWNTKNDVGRVTLAYELEDEGLLHRVAYMLLPHREIPKKYFSDFADIFDAVSEQAEEKLAFSKE